MSEEIKETNNVKEENVEVKPVDLETASLTFYNDLIALIMRHNLPVWCTTGTMEYAKVWLINYGLSSQPEQKEEKDVQDK